MFSHVMTPDEDASPENKAEAILNAFFRAPAQPVPVHADNRTVVKLDLSSCGLTQIPDRLSMLASKHPAHAASITLLNLANNRLRTLPDFLTKLPNLRILFLLRNKFTEIPKSLPNLFSLRMLSFKDNALHGELQVDRLPHNLTWLILTSNRLTLLPPSFARRCRHVRKLMLSNNLLSAIPPLSTDMHALELLRLANNRLSTFPAELLWLRTLRWLALGGNPCCPTPALPPALPEAEIDVDWGKLALGSGTSGAVFDTRDESAVVKRFAAAAGSDGTAADEVAVACALGSRVSRGAQILGYARTDKGMGDLLLVSKKVPHHPRLLAGPPSFASCTRSVYPRFLLTQADKNSIIQDVMQAVEDIAKAGVAHGDVYAHNVLVARPPQGRPVRATLVDYGAAWVVPPQYRKQVRSIEQRALDVFIDEVDKIAEIYLG